MRRRVRLFRRLSDVMYPVGGRVRREGLERGGGSRRDRLELPPHAEVTPVVVLHAPHERLPGEVHRFAEVVRIRLRRAVQHEHIADVHRPEQRAPSAFVPEPRVPPEGFRLEHPRRLWIRPAHGPQRRRAHVRHVVLRYVILRVSNLPKGIHEVEVIGAKVRRELFGERGAEGLEERVARVDEVNGTNRVVALACNLTELSVLHLLRLVVVAAAMLPLVLIPLVLILVLLLLLAAVAGVMGLLLLLGILLLLLVLLGVVPLDAHAREPIIHASYLRLRELGRDRRRDVPVETRQHRRHAEVAH